MFVWTAAAAVRPREPALGTMTAQKASTLGRDWGWGGWGRGAERERLVFVRLSSLLTHWGELSSLQRAKHRLAGMCVDKRPKDRW